MAEITERIGQRIRDLREAKKRDDPRWTQDYLARQLPGIRTGSEVSRWERGEVKPRDETLQEIAKALGVDVAEFYAKPEATPAASPLDALSPPALELAPALEELRQEVARLSALFRDVSDRGLSAQTEQLTRLSEVRSAQAEILSRLEQIERGRGAAGGS